MSKNLKIIPTQEYEEIVATVMKYVDGLRIGKSSDVAKAFLPDAVMYGFANGKLLAGPIKNLYDFVDENGNAPKIKVRLDVIGVTPSTAVVKVDMEKDAIDADYTDFHTLIKIDGKWSVIAKVFHMYEG